MSEKTTVLSQFALVSILLFMTEYSAHANNKTDSYMFYICFILWAIFIQITTYTYNAKQNN